MRSRTIIATPPGATIREQLDDRGMTQKEFALRMDMSEKHISQLINGDVRLTPSVALRLESVLGVPASFWNNLETRYREKLLQVEEENAMDRDIALSKLFPYAEMVRYNWIEKTSNPVEKVRNLRRYFEVARLDIIDHLSMPGIAYRRLAVTEKSDYSLAVWAQQAKLQARDKKVALLNLQKLSDDLPYIRSMTMDKPETFCPKLEQELSDCGIALVLLPHMQGSFLHGASFIDGKKVVMGLTVRGRDADRFWFSLFHELDHVLEQHIDKPHGPTQEDEDHANIFARDLLISPDDYAKLIENKNVNSQTVVSFAAEVGIDPGIVVGRLQNDGVIKHNVMNELKTQYIFS